MSSLLGGNKKQTSTTTSNSNPTLPSWLKAPMKDIISRGTELSNQAYTPYTGDRVSQLSGDETDAISMIRNLVGQAPADMQQSKDITSEVARRGLEGFSQQELQQYMNPYTENVLDVGRRRQFENYDKIKADMMRRQGQSAAFGGSRSGLAEAQLSGDFQQQLSDYDTQGLYNSYNEGMNRAFQGTQLAGQSSMDLANIINMGQNSALQGINALSGAGAQQRGIEQRGLDVNYEDFLKEKAFPYEQLQFLSGLVYPAADMMKGQTATSTNVQSTQGGSGILGAALGLGSMAMGIPGVSSALGLGSTGMGGLFGVGSSIGGMMGLGNQSVGFMDYLNPGARSDIGYASQGGFGPYRFREGGQVPMGIGYADGGLVGKLSDFVKYMEAWNNGDEEDAIGRLYDLGEVTDPKRKGEPYTQEELQAFIDKQDQLDKYLSVGKGINGSTPSYPDGPTRDQNQALWAGSDPAPNVSEGPFANLINKAAETHGIPAALLNKLVGNESSFDPNAVSSAGAKGLGQINPITAKHLGVKNVFDPAENINASAKYLKELNQRFDGDWAKTLAAYNWGPTNLDKFGMSKIPPETRDYLGKFGVKGYADGGAVGDLGSDEITDELFNKGFVTYNGKLYPLNSKAAKMLERQHKEENRVSNEQVKWSDAEKLGLALLGKSHYQIPRKARPREDIPQMFGPGYADGGQIDGLHNYEFPNPLRALLSEKELEKVKAANNGKPNPALKALADTAPIKKGNQLAEWIIDNPVEAAGWGLTAVPFAGPAAKALGAATKGLKLAAGGAKAYPKLAAGATGLGLLALGGNDASPVDKMKSQYALENQQLAKAGKERTTNPDTQKAVADLVANMIKSRTETPAAFDPSQHANSLAKKDKGDFNAPLFKFGATLLGSDNGFFKAVGEAGDAYVTTKKEEEDRVLKQAKDAAELQMQAIKTALYGKSVDAQTQKLNNPWTQMIQQLKVQKMQKELAGGGDYAKTRDMIFKTIMGGGMEKDEITAMQKAENLAMTLTVAGAPSAGDEPVQSAFDLNSMTEDDLAGLDVGQLQSIIDAYGQE